MTPVTDLELAYRFDEELWELYLTFEPKTIELEELVTFFYLPFRLRAGDVELFWSPPDYDDEDSYLPALPLLGFVLDLQRETEFLASGNYTTLIGLDTYGSLSLTRQAGDYSLVRLYTSMSATEVLTTWAAWAEAVATLVATTRRLFSERLPELAAHPELGPWLKTGTLPTDV